MKQFTSSIEQNSKNKHTLWISSDGRQSTGLVELTKDDLKSIAKTIHTYLGNDSDMIDCSNSNEVVEFVLCIR
jgi:hypothetical protein